jgi:hypothetical protein
MREVAILPKAVSAESAGTVRVIKPAVRPMVALHGEETLRRMEESAVVLFATLAELASDVAALLRALGFFLVLVLVLVLHALVIMVVSTPLPNTVADNDFLHSLCSYSSTPFSHALPVTRVVLSVVSPSCVHSGLSEDCLRSIVARPSEAEERKLAHRRVTVH